MDPERWQRIKEVLHSALERAPQERSAFVNDACAGDSSLRSEVEALIASHEQAGGFIESPAFELMADSLEDKTDSLAGQSLGHYQVISLLGAGGMGEVYLAEDTRLGRKIALKILTTHFTQDSDRLRRFQQEARAASALNHPNILTIHEIGEIDSRHFMVTEFIEGETLRRRMAKAQVTTPEALRIASHIASALYAAHAAGIVHRDIKPENVMLREDGITKVLDFGLAKLTDRKIGEAEAMTLVKTEQGMVMGTAHYMSPEQARGLPVDARTDIWSLGVVLYEMVGGRVPFEGRTSSDVIAAILEKKPIVLARYAPDISHELEWIVEKTLRKDREERYQTTKEFLTDLRNLKRRLEFEDLDHSDSGQRSTELDRRPGSGSYEASHVKAQSKGSQSHNVIDSLAILPLVNTSADPGMDYFSDGITESIISSLSQLAELRVMAWSTVSRYKGKDISPQEVGRELGVRAVLTGRVLHVGERLVVGAELVDTTDETQLWGKHYNRNLSDIFEVQEEIAHEISEALRLRLTGKEQKRLAKRYTENTEAYQLYLKGLHFFNKKSVEGYKKAIVYYQQAIEIDPNYALAYAGLADCYANSSFAEISPKDAIIKARTAAIKALEIDDTLAEAHNALAHVKVNLYWDWLGAEREFRVALELNPNYAEAHHRYSHYLVAMGRFEESLTESSRCLELDPLDLTMNTHLGWHYLIARQEDQAIEQLTRTLELDQSFINARLYLGRAYERKGMCRDAIAEIQKVRDFYGQSQIASGLLGHVYAVAGKKDEAEKTIEELKEQSKREYVWPYNIAIIHVGLGEKDQAFEWLEKACEDRSDDLIYLKVEPMFDPLRSDPRFTDLLRRVGLAPVESFRPAMFSAERRETETMKEQAARLTTRTAPSQSWWSRREAKIFLALGVVFLLAGLGYLLLRSGWQSKEPTSSLKKASFTQLTYEPGPEFFPSLSPDDRSLAYASRASGNWDIYLQRVGGRNPINLTKDSPADDTQPAFSPDGDRIAFRSERDGGGIYSMNSSGESVTRLSSFGYSPAWSPEGEHIFVGTEKIPQPSTRPSKSQLWTINTRTNERRLITEGDALQPNCSPHGNRIAFWSRPSKIGQRDSIWTIPADGGDAVAVTDGTTTDSNPVWSPDGEFLYFSSNRGGSVNIWRVAIDEKSGAVSGQPEAVTTIGAATSALQLSFARDVRKLAYIAQDEIRNLRKISFDPSSGKATSEPSSITRGSMQLWFPDASPDGEWLTCYSMGNQRHIFIMRTDGSELRDLTDDTFRHFWPRWSPDGKRIAFSSRRSGNYEIWAINRDGSGLQQLTRDHASPGAHYSPWSPDGKRIAYSIHAPRNECIIFEPGKSWSEQKLEYLSPLSDASLSFEGWSWSSDGKKLAGVRHLPSGIHSGIGVYDLESRHYDWLTDFGDWPLWLNDNRRLLFVSQGKIFLFDIATRKYEPVLTVTDQDVDIGSPSLSPDNKTLYFTFVAAEADIWLMALE